MRDLLKLLESIENESRMSDIDIDAQENSREEFINMHSG